MKPRDITIKTVLNGYRVQVGCKEVVFVSAAKMLEQLEYYLAHPKDAEAILINDAVYTVDEPSQVDAVEYLPVNAVSSGPARG